MFIVVCLGNYGKQYENTRHNAGFLLADALVGGKLEWVTFKSSLIAKIHCGEDSVLIAKPQTFMNLSGKAVLELMSFYKIEKKHVIIAHDDADVELGMVRVKIGGSDGGHNGLKSVTKTIGGDYLRLRIGVSRPPEYQDLADYVLQNFTSEEALILNSVIGKIVKNLDFLLKNQFDHFISSVNCK